MSTTPQRQCPICGSRRRSWVKTLLCCGRPMGPMPGSPYHDGPKLYPFQQQILDAIESGAEIKLDLSRRHGKSEYIKAAGQTRDHHCHWPGCDAQVKPAVWGCRRHWFMLPKGLRDRIWTTFRPGQETNWTPSAAYVEAARAAQDWIKENYPS